MAIFMSFRIKRLLHRLFTFALCVFCLATLLPLRANAAAELTFSESERAIIEISKNIPVSVGVITSAEPVCSLDAKSGEFAGITMDILKVISETTGLQFEYVPIDLTRNTPIGWLKEGTFDVVAGILRSETFVNDPELALSAKLMDDSIVMISRLGEDFTKDPESKTIAVLSGYQVGLEYVKTQFPQHKVVTYPSFEDCLEAVKSGKADASVYMRVCANYLLKNPRYEKLCIVPVGSKDITTCCAALSKNNCTIIDIIDKGLSTLNDTDRNNIIMIYTMLNPYTPTLADRFYEHRLVFILIGMLLALIVFVLIVLLRYRRKSSHSLSKAKSEAESARQHAEKAKEEASLAAAKMQATSDKLLKQIAITLQWQEASETDDLTGLLNRRGGEQRIRSLLEHHVPGVFCLFDIDRFKAINDTYGHESGDAALEAIAQCMRTFRGSDVQMRFGGDEFIVFAVDIITEQQARECIERFIECLNHMYIAGITEACISISAGLVLVSAESEFSFESLYHIADDAMYLCKRDPAIHYYFAEKR